MANESLIFDILARDGASPSLKKVGDAALEASGSLKDLSSKLKDVNGRTAAARVKLDGDKEAQAELDKMDVKLIKLGKTVATGKVGLEGVARARAEISGLDVALDRLDAKHATASVGVSGGGRGGILGKLSGLLGGSGGAGGAGGGGGLLGSPLGIGGLIGGGLLAAGSVPSLVGTGIGGGVGLGAIAGGLFGAKEGTKVLKADTANITQITTALKTAIGQQKKLLSADLVAANKQFAKDSNFYAPFLGFQKSLTGLAQVILKPLRGVMGPLAGIFTQFGKGLTLLGPLMTAMFRASLPFIRQFLQFMLQAGKTLMPAFTQAMTEMVKSGALKEMTQGLVYLVQGLAGFVVALGPGMKASAQIFERICLVIKGAMIGVGVVVSFIANALEFNFPAAVGRMRRDVVSSFDALRHDVSSIWDTLWNNTLGRLQRGIADDQRIVAGFRHTIAGTFDNLRHDIAAVWDTIWNNTVTRVKNGISDVVGWFKGVTGRVTGALFGFGHSLYAFAHSAMTDFWNALKNVGASVWNWLTGWVKALPGWLRKLLHISSPSGVFYDIGRNMMLGLFHGIKDHAWKASHAAQQVAAGLNVFGAGPGGGAPAANAALARKLMPAWGSGMEWNAWNALEMMEAGWNQFARNPSSGAYGIPQALPPSKMGAAANPPQSNPTAQIRWMIGYIKSRYGDPIGAVAHENAFHWYDKGGWLMPGLTLAVNKTGRPEQILPPGGHSGTHVVWEVRARHGATSFEHALVEIIQKFVIVSGGGDVQAALGQKA